jgi:DNA-binding PadR family transcriptional regulator
MRHVDPLTEPVYLILLSLATRPRHGYALIQDIDGFTNGRVRMSTGTLYGILRRLLESEWIERYEQDDTSRDKHAYQLTSLGRTQMQGEFERMKELTRAAAARLRAARAL